MLTKQDGTQNGLLGNGIVSMECDLSGGFWKDSFSRHQKRLTYCQKTFLNTCAVFLSTCAVFRSSRDQNRSRKIKKVNFT